MATKFGKLFGTDKLLGTDGDDLLIALGAKTTLDGGAGNDTLIGGVNDDILIGGTGADVLIGGLGTDTADYSKSDAGVTVDLTTGRGSGGDAQGDTLFSIENIIGSAHDDVLKGDRGNNAMTGGDGADVFVMTTGKDTITDFKPTVPTVDKVIDFNDITISSTQLTPVPAGYGGLDWSGFDANPGPPNSGLTLLGGGTLVAMLYARPSGEPVSGTAATAGADFTLKSAYMASAYVTISVTVEGWDDGVLKVAQTFQIGLERTLVNFVGFDSIDKFAVTASAPEEGETYVGIDDITLAFDGAPGDKIRVDTPLGMTVDQMIANAVSDGHGGTLLKYQGGQLDLQGIAPHDVKAEWFV
ncbi:MAG: hypothetical protein U1E23_14970 [Reyranellaceae bacterium]